MPQVVFENIPQVSEISDLFISGLSMGGFGALRLGIKYSRKFNAISAHSAITAIEQMPLFVEESLENFKQENDKENSVLGVIAKYGNNLPKIRFDCGSEDELVIHNRELHFQLAASNIEHVYEEFQGGHEWSYWQKQIGRTLKFFSDLTNFQR